MKITSDDKKPGVFVGGQYFTADKDGTIEVPDSATGLADLGFKPYVEPVKPAAKEKQSKED